jgi:hypothetical protein
LVVDAAIVRRDIVIVEKQALLYYGRLSKADPWLRKAARTSLEARHWGGYLDPRSQKVGEAREGREEEKTDCSSSAKDCGLPPVEVHHEIVYEQRNEAHRTGTCLCV